MKVIIKQKVGIGPFSFLLMLWYIINGYLLVYYSSKIRAHQESKSRGVHCKSALIETAELNTVHKACAEKHTVELHYIQCRECCND